MNHFESFDCYFDEYGDQALVNKIFEIDCVHNRNTERIKLEHYDINSTSGQMYFKLADRHKVKQGDLVEIKELKYTVENILDEDNGLLVAILSDYKVSDGYIDFDL